MLGFVQACLCLLMTDTHGQLAAEVLSARPADPTARPADPTARPADPTARPADPTARPADPAAHPADPAARTRGSNCPPYEPDYGAGPRSKSIFLPRTGKEDVEGEGG